MRPSMKQHLWHIQRKKKVVFVNVSLAGFSHLKEFFLRRSPFSPSLATLAHCVPVLLGKLSTKSGSRFLLVLTSEPERVSWLFDEALLGYCDLCELDLLRGCCHVWLYIE